MIHDSIKQILLKTAMLCGHRWTYRYMQYDMWPDRLTAIAQATGECHVLWVSSRLFSPENNSIRWLFKHLHLLRFPDKQTLVGMWLLTVLSQEQRLKKHDDSVVPQNVLRTRPKWIVWSTKCLPLPLCAFDTETAVWILSPATCINGFFQPWPGSFPNFNM